MEILWILGWIYFGVKKRQSGVTTQRAVEAVQKQKILEVFLFIFFNCCFHTFYFYFFFHHKQSLKQMGKMLSHGRQTWLKIYWSTCAVLVAFYIKKAKKWSRYTTQDKNKRRNDLTMHAEKAIHNLTKGLGVSLAKTPFEVLLHKTDEPKKQVFYGIFFLRVLFFVVLSFYLPATNCFKIYWNIIFVYCDI